MTIKIGVGDCRKVLRKCPDDYFDCVVTSPPYYGLRDYGNDAQIGRGASPLEFVEELVSVFKEVLRVMKPTATCWLNIGDSYAGSGRGGNPEANTLQSTNKGSLSVGVLYHKNAKEAQLERQKVKEQFAAQAEEGFKKKDLLLIPSRLAIRLQEEGFYVRSEILWHKTNAMVESVLDRPTSSHEKVWLLTKSSRYYFDREALSEKGVGGEIRYGRNVWTIPTAPIAEAHFGTMPPELARRCIKAGCPEGGYVLDPFGGSGTTGVVAKKFNRNAVLIELNPEYAAIARRRVDSILSPPRRMA